MLSYRHAFHAGNYADVLKHLVLSRTLDYLTQKSGPVCYIDTHAGAGGYSLVCSEAKKTGEFNDGIGLLWQRKDLPAPLAEYRALVEQFNEGRALRNYPGSPWIARQLLRKQDRMELCELHPKDHPRLAALFKGERRVNCYFEDGFKRSLALVPPVERRGLVLIDPSYEIKDDYAKVVKHIKALHKRFATGTFALWYPVVDEQRVRTLEKAFVNSGMRNIELYEVSLTEDHDQKGMTGSGMIVVNPPWTLKKEVREALDWFAPLVSETGQPLYRVVQLVAE
ncbi:MAG: 23S rRNA (adenine(2030)-N(6))-methyltransferase RlmJ [Halopseudomonas sp.]